MANPVRYHIQMIPMERTKDIGYLKKTVESLSWHGILRGLIDNKPQLGEEA